MTVEDLFRELSFGELSNLALAVDASGTIKTSQHPRVIHFANEALTRLYSRFLIEEKDVLIEPVEGTTSYDLPTDLVQILNVYNAFGQVLPLNDSSSRDSLFTPKYNVLFIPTGLKPGTLDVSYQARHPLLTVPQIQVEYFQEILLPQEFHEALKAYIAAKMYGGMNTPEALQAAAMHQARFENICSEASGPVGLTGTSQNTKFSNRGFA